LKKNLTAYAFIAPAVILYAILGVYTVGYGIALSFFRWNGFAPRWIWMGLDNFKDFLYANPNVSRVFWEAARNNIVLMVALPVGVILISLPLAIALNNVKRFAALFRSVFFLPLVTSGIAVYYVWRWIYEPSGLLNTLLRGVGLRFLAPENGFLGSINMALPSVIWVMIWSSVPFAIILYLTGLQAIDLALFDAARVDGATRFQILRRILWPLLYPTTGIIVILNLNTALQGFETVLLMTNGGPTNHTNVLGLMIYTTAFQQGDLGLASALGWSLFVLSFGIAFINLKIFRQQT
jgi:multiple sugar transport system permease protein/raffinose/stachyose/melibiose transport system permease protein